MKLIILAHMSDSEFYNLVNIANRDNLIVALNTASMTEKKELKRIQNLIREFKDSANEIFLIKFSGREFILREIGDETSEIIVSLNSNKNSRNYTDNPANIFLDLIHMFKKETV